LLKTEEKKVEHASGNRTGGPHPRGGPNEPRGEKRLAPPVPPPPPPNTPAARKKHAARVKFCRPPVGSFAAYHEHRPLEGPRRGPQSRGALGGKPRSDATRPGPEGGDCWGRRQKAPRLHPTSGKDTRITAIETNGPCPRLNPKGGTTAPAPETHTWTSVATRGGGLPSVKGGERPWPEGLLTGK